MERPVLRLNIYDLWAFLLTKNNNIFFFKWHLYNTFVTFLKTPVSPAAAVGGGRASAQSANAKYLQWHSEGGGGGWAMSNSWVDVGYRVGSAAEDQITDLKRPSTGEEAAKNCRVGILLPLTSLSDRTLKGWRETFNSILKLVRPLEERKTKQRKSLSCVDTKRSVVFGGLGGGAGVAGTRSSLGGDALKSGDTDEMVVCVHRLFYPGETDRLCPQQKRGREEENMQRTGWRIYRPGGKANLAVCIQRDLPGEWALQRGWCVCCRLDCVL